jgi:hypothetical protein
MGGKYVFSNSQNFYRHVYLLAPTVRSVKQKWLWESGRQFSCMLPRIIEFTWSVVPMWRCWHYSMSYIVHQNPIGEGLLISDAVSASSFEAKVKPVCLNGWMYVCTFGLLQLSHNPPTSFWHSALPWAWRVRLTWWLLLRTANWCRTNDRMEFSYARGLTHEHGWKL